MEITSRLESKASRENHFMSPQGATVNSQGRFPPLEHLRIPLLTIQCTP
jgi:hypothetical protein